MQNPFEDIIERLDNIERFLVQINAKEATPSPTDVETLLTIDELAKLLDLAKPTLYSKVSRQEIPYVKQGKRLYFIKADIMEWLKIGKNPTKAEIQANTDKHLAQIKRRKQA